MRAVFGVKSFEKGQTKTNDFSLNLSFAGKESDQAINAHLLSEVQKLDEFMVNTYGIEHSKMIFGQKYDIPAVVKALYTATVKYAKEDPDKFPPRLAPKVPKDREDENKPNIGVFDGQNKIMNIATFVALQEAIPKGSLIQAVIFPRMWFLGTKFGVTWSIHQVKVKPSAFERPKGCAFGDDGGGGDDEVADPKGAANSAAGAKKASTSSKQESSSAKAKTTPTAKAAASKKEESETEDAEGEEEEEGEEVADSDAD
jgi:hypothetical protein